MGWKPPTSYKAINLNLKLPSKKHSLKLLAATRSFKGFVMDPSMDHRMRRGEQIINILDLPTT